VSRASFARGLRDGAQGARPIMQDEDYDRGYTLGGGDVRARLAMYDQEQRRARMTVDEELRPCPGAESLPAMLAELRR